MNKLVVITTPYFFADEASLIELYSRKECLVYIYVNRIVNVMNWRAYWIKSLRLITTGSFFMIGLPWQKKGL